MLPIGRMSSADYVRKTVCAFCEQPWQISNGSTQTQEMKNLELIAVKHFVHHVIAVGEPVDSQSFPEHSKLLRSIILCANCVANFARIEVDILKAQRLYLSNMSGMKDLGEILADPWLDLKRLAYPRLKLHEDTITQSIRLLENYRPLASPQNTCASPQSSNPNDPATITGNVDSATAAGPVVLADTTANIIQRRGINGTSKRQRSAGDKGTFMVMSDDSSDASSSSVSPPHSDKNQADRVQEPGTSSYSVASLNGNLPVVRLETLDFPSNLLNASRGSSIHEAETGEVEVELPENGDEGHQDNTVMNEPENMVTTFDFEPDESITGDKSNGLNETEDGHETIETSRQSAAEKSAVPVAENEVNIEEETQPEDEYIDHDQKDDSRIISKPKQSQSKKRIKNVNTEQKPVSKRVRLNSSSQSSVTNSSRSDPKMKAPKPKGSTCRASSVARGSSPKGKGKPKPSQKVDSLLERFGKTLTTLTPPKLPRDKKLVKIGNRVVISDTSSDEEDKDYVKPREEDDSDSE